MNTTPKNNRGSHRLRRLRKTTSLWLALAALLILVVGFYRIGRYFPPTVPATAPGKQPAAPSGWIVYASGMISPGSPEVNQLSLGRANPRTGRVEDTVAPLPGQAPVGLVPLPDGKLLLVNIGGPAVAVAEVTGTAYAWDPATGAFTPQSLYFKPPFQGTMFTGMELGGAVAGNGAFAVYGFHGGGIGEIYQFLTPEFQKASDYSPPPAATSIGPYWYGQFACFPPVLAAAPNGAWLLRGAVSSDDGPACAYGLLGPAGKIVPYSALNSWKRKAPAAAYSPGGRHLALLTTRGGLWLAKTGGTPSLLTHLPLPPAYNPAQATLSPARPSLAWSPNGRYLLAGYGGNLRLYRLDHGFSFIKKLSLPRGTTVWDWLPGSPPAVPASIALTTAEKSLAAQASAATVLIPAPAGTAPNVAVRLATPSGSVSLPVARCSWGQFGGSWCLVPRGVRISAVPSLAAKAKTNWVLLPPAGWLPKGMYTITAIWPGGGITRRVGATVG